MSEVRLVKKYPNRRLYDCHESRYITLQDLRRLVVENIEFKVIDKMSGKDISNSVLLQVVTDQEQSGDALLGKEFLLQLIRFYGGSMEKAVRGYLNQSLEMFTAQEHV